MPTLTLQTDGFNDLFMPDGRNLVVISGSTACKQDILQRVLMRKGEDVYDQSNGVDYFGTVFTSSPDYDAARKSLIDSIKRCADVVSVDSLEIFVDGNTFNFAAQVMTTYGPLTVRN
jgi:hypothetical protein